MSSATRTALATLAAGAAGVLAYAFLVEPRWIQVTRPRIHVRGLHPHLEGVRIALLSDLHAGGGVPYSVLRRACRLAMEARPHLIALTGDLVDDRAHSFEPVLDAVSTLRAPLGVYAVPGNHDHRVGIGRWRRDVGADPVVRDLTNDAVILRVGAARLCVAGVDDYSCGDPDLGVLPPPAARDATVLLAHDPDQAESARRAYDRVDLVLSGHTHAGQVQLPGYGAIRNPARHRDLYEEGLRRRPWTQVYVSRGIGTTDLPVRFLSRPEVAVLELTGAPRPQLPRRGKTAQRRASPTVRGPAPELQYRGRDDGRAGA